MYNSHEEEKKKEYGPRVLQVEKATMTAAVMSTLGGIRLSRESDKLVRRTDSNDAKPEERRKVHLQ